MSTKVREYIYTDERSRPRLRKLRRDPKAFSMWSWVRGEHKDFWGKGIRDHQQAFSECALYRLPELMWTLDAGLPVYWCEGEKCADAVTGALNVSGVGTTHWQGACHATAEQAAWFRQGRGPILLVADVDGAGAACVLIRHQLLVDARVSPSRLTIVAPPHPYKDAAEAIQAGVPLDKFREPSRARLRVAANRYAQQRARGGERGDSDWYGANGQFLNPFRTVS